MIRRLKDYRRIEIRCDKLARNLLTGRSLGTTVAYWLNRIWNLRLKMRERAQEAALGHERQNEAGQDGPVRHLA